MDQAYRSMAYNNGLDVHSLMQPQKGDLLISSTASPKMLREQLSSQMMQVANAGNSNSINTFQNDQNDIQQIQFNVSPNLQQIAL